jgi:hypothetical protein
VRRDRVDDTGSLTLRLAGRLHHVGVGRTHARTHVLMLIRDLDVRIINAATGELIRELTIDPTRDYQPRRVPCGRRPKKKPRTPNAGSELFVCLDTSHRADDGNRTRVFGLEVDSGRYPASAEVYESR